MDVRRTKESYRHTHLLGVQFSAGPITPISSSQTDPFSNVPAYEESPPKLSLSKKKSPPKLSFLWRIPPKLLGVPSSSVTSVPIDVSVSVPALEVPACWDGCLLISGRYHDVFPIGSGALFVARLFPPESEHEMQPPTVLNRIGMTIKPLDPTHSMYILFATYFIAPFHICFYDNNVQLLNLAYLRTTRRARPDRSSWQVHAHTMQARKFMAWRTIMDEPLILYRHSQLKTNVVIRVDGDLTWGADSMQRPGVFTVFSKGKKKWGADLKSHWSRTV